MDSKVRDCLESPSCAHRWLPPRFAHPNTHHNIEVSEGSGPFPQLDRLAPRTVFSPCHAHLVPVTSGSPPHTSFPPVKPPPSRFPSGLTLSILFWGAATHPGQSQ